MLILVLNPWKVVMSYPVARFRTLQEHVFDETSII